MFEAILGQDRLQQTLEQMSVQDRLPHALLFRGPDGSGKRLLAMHLAAWLVCGQQVAPESSPWQAVMRLEHPDVHVVPPLFSKTVDGKKLTSQDFLPEFRAWQIANPWGMLNEWGEALYDSDTFRAKEDKNRNKQFTIPIEEVRQLQRRFVLRSQPGAWRIIVLWHAEKLNISAANAFLKLLEEPPERTLIILTVGEGATLLPTLNSRCQTLHFRRVPVPALQQWLQVAHSVPAAHAEEIALIADGSPGRALLLAQTTENPFRTAFMDWMRLCYEGNEAKIQAFANHLQGQSLEYQKLFLQFSLQKLRDAVTHLAGVPQLAQATPAEQQFLEKFSQFLSLESIARMELIIEDALRQLSGYIYAPLLFSVLCHRIHQQIRPMAV
ncbi:MAG: hypothetical protein KF690_10520 [Bacteroidetes bacterium]|nr:hypothetical protein [Bacteroidota bacterium]